MKKLLALLILAIFYNSVFSQNLNNLTSVNEKHINVKGTNIFMIPPTGFTASLNFKGFQNKTDQNSMIMVVEIPGPFLKVTEGFNTEQLKSRGMDLKSKEIKVVNDYQAILISLEQESNSLKFSKYILVYGNDKFTKLINGVFLKDSIDLGVKIKESIISTFVDKTKNFDPRTALDYSLDENVGQMKFKAVIGNGFLFNRDLKTPTESPDKASIITDKSFSEGDIPNKKLFCISRVKKYPDDHSVIVDKGINEITIDGLKGYELFAKNNVKTDEELYQVILFKEDGGYYIFCGTYAKKYDNAKNDIIKIIKTFKRKS